MPAALDPAKRAAIEEAIREGATSLGAIARQHETSTSAVSRIAKRLETDEGLAPWWQRPKTKNAREAKAEDNAAERERLRGLLLQDAHRLREQLWNPCVFYNFGGKDNTLNSIQLDQPTFDQQRQIMTSVGIAVDKIVRLDVGEAAETQAASLIEALVGDIRARRRGEAAPDASG